MASSNFIWDNHGKHAIKNTLSNIITNISWSTGKGQYAQGSLLAHKLWHGWKQVSYPTEMWPSQGKPWWLTLKAYWGLGATAKVCPFSHQIQSKETCSNIASIKGQNQEDTWYKCIMYIPWIRQYIKSFKQVQSLRFNQFKIYISNANDIYCLDCDFYDLVIC